MVTIKRTERDKPYDPSATWEDLKNERKLNILKQYVSKNLRKNDLKLLQLYSTETIKKITESGLIYDFR